MLSNVNVDFSVYINVFLYFFLCPFCIPIHKKKKKNYTYIAGKTVMNIKEVVIIWSGDVVLGLDRGLQSSGDFQSSMGTFLSKDTSLIKFS